jgi:two-component SAPR family response regulator
LNDVTSHPENPESLLREKGTHSQQPYRLPDLDFLGAFMLQKSLLIIEQEERAINGLTTALSRNFRLIFVPFNTRALNILSEESIDLIILSRCLPDGNSLEILEIIRKKYPCLPVVLLADSPNQEYIITAFRLGASDFFVKPFNEAEFNRRLHQLLELPGVFGGEKEAAEFEARSSAENMNSFREKRRNWLRMLFSLFSVLQRELPEFPKKKSAPNLAATQNPIAAPEPVEANLPEMQINFLGKFQVILNHQEIEEWPGRKTEDVFAYLIYHHNRRVHRDVLMDRFWPDALPDSARNCLNVTLHSIRKVFEKIDATREYIYYRHECYFVNPEIELKIDVEAFLNYWKLAQSTERENGMSAAISQYELAAATYNGDFFGDNFCTTWADLDRENLKEIYMEILNKLSNYYSLDGKPDVAIGLCDLILKKDNCREDVHRRLMRCYFRIGQRDKAIRQFNKCAEILKSELELSPSKATVQLFEKIRQAL